MGLGDGYGQAAGQFAAAQWERLTCALGRLVELGQQVATATTGTARTMAYQYGVPPLVGDTRLAPRAMTTLPAVVEGGLTESVTLDMFEMTGRMAQAGYIANIGDNPIYAAWIAVDGSHSGLFTLPPSTTVQLPCILKGVMFTPKDGQYGEYQVSLS